MIDYEITTTDSASKPLAPNKIVHYLAIFTVNMSKISFKLFDFIYDQNFNKKDVLTPITYYVSVFRKGKL